MLTLKRLLEFIFTICLIVILSPIYLIVSICVYLKLGKPVLFKQTRPGKDSKIFNMYKFRTMLNITDKDGKALSDAERLTKFGRFLRSASLDELPELINVIKGDMSLVGPRPLLNEYLELYTPEQKRRHDVRPGITGWAQVNGRNAISWEEKFKLDIWYVDNWSLWLDIKILFLTIYKVFKRDGISHQNSATMEKYKGISG
jgi:sugar transferase EpsL